MKVGTTELILILVVALVVFGPSKLPELGRLAGQAVGSFKKYLNTFEGEWSEESQQPQEKQTPATSAVPAPAKSDQEPCHAENSGEITGE